MYRAFLLTCLAIVPVASVQAFDPYSSGFWQQPYGLRTDTFVPTPPYFSVFPPVYYGERYSRPYGISPFPAQAQVGVPESYKAAPRAEFLKPIIQNPHCSGGCVGGSAASAAQGSVAGNIQHNPFVQPTMKLTNGKSL